LFHSGRAKEHATGLNDNNGGVIMVQTLKKAARVSEAERRYLVNGLSQAGNKLPLFDHNGQEISHSLIQSCIDKGLGSSAFKISRKLL